MMGEECVQSVVIQANGIKESRRSLHCSPGRVTRTRREGDCLGENATKLPQVDERFHLPGVAEGARGYQNGVC